MGVVKISTGNSKLGAIPSVSLPSGVTCRACDCQKKCYANRLERRRPAVAKAYAHNLEVLRSDPNTYWREVEAAIMLSRFFRFHVSGDIVDGQYFRQMALIAERQRHCEILCFTKKYEIVNEYLSEVGIIPSNLRMVFSVWTGLEAANPFLLPEAHVRYRDGTTTARDEAVICGGNCAQCATTEDGCWSLKNNEQVVFYEH